MVEKIMIRLIKIFSLTLVLLCGCADVGNNEVAYIEIKGDRFLLEVSGNRRLMAHDPVSLFLGKTRVEKEVFNVPRISGVVRGEEIPVEKGYYGYIGLISFEGEKVVIDLSYMKNDKLKSIGWNGVYRLQKR